ncbi:TetR/AcrR family transcriptional regulator [Klenkia terrae]|uniref:TetR/AcrR family transcriptional regulator n=1 Tax=Klenkia terrae TaxID=1052259 RepID=A0ABU8E6A9_9ACTN|nr:TetR/AcrR family transcriptional regulator [Klenkia terrae]
MAARSGRPLDGALTVTLLDCTLEILAQDGLGRITTDVVAARAQAGKSAIYRRWPSAQELVVDALRTCTLVPDVTDTGSLRGDLVALLDPWTHPLDRCERAASALLGHAGRGTVLDEVLERGVVQPLAAAVTRITDRHAARADVLTGVQVRLLVVVVQSMWWQRYTSNRPASTTAEVEQMVDLVLLPITTS